MIGAIIGDIVGSIYDFGSPKTKEFPLFSEHCFFTGDTVMTLAVAEALMRGGKPGDFVSAMKEFGRLYPDAGYGAHFYDWLMSDDCEPYESFGNGSAMRVSPCAWFANSLSEAEELAEISAAVTHNHPEGIKGAKAVAAAIYIARSTHGNKAGIKEYIESTYGYDLNRTLDEIRLEYKFNETCQGTVPEAIIAYLESDRFEGAIRNAMSLGGDSHTLTAITGSIAEAGSHVIPTFILRDAFAFLDDRLSKVLNDWYDIGKSPLQVLEAISANHKESSKSEKIKANFVLSEHIGFAQVLYQFLGLRIIPDEISRPKTIKADICLSEKEFARVRYLSVEDEVLPKEMQHKWQVYYENGRISISRNATRHKIYEAEILKGESGYFISEISVERDPGKYSYADDKADLLWFDFLLKKGMLGIDVPLPSTANGEGVLRYESSFGIRKNLDVNNIFEHLRDGGSLPEIKVNFAESGSWRENRTDKLLWAFCRKLQEMNRMIPDVVEIDVPFSKDALDNEIITNMFRAAYGIVHQLNHSEMEAIAGKPLLDIKIDYAAQDTIELSATAVLRNLFCDKLRELKGKTLNKIKISVPFTKDSIVNEAILHAFDSACYICNDDWD